MIDAELVKTYSIKNKEDIYYAGSHSLNLFLNSNPIEILFVCVHDCEYLSLIYFLDFDKKKKRYDNLNKL